MRITPASRAAALLLVTAPLWAQSPADFFERNIRPVLAGKCYACHSSKAKSPMGGLALDTAAGLRKAVVPGKPEESRLFKAIRFTDPQLQMPPTGKLPGAVISDFERWIAAGAPDPRQDAAGPAPARPGIDFAKGRQWWAFQPLREPAAPAVSNPAWPRKKIDAFVLARLDSNRLRPSPEAARRTLIRRASYDLTGLPPTYEETEAFAADPAPDAYDRLVEKLLASPRYGERWGRYWLDVARWAEDHPTSEVTNQPHPFAWRYRDWVIEAFNKDIPYDRFLRMQFAADLLPGFDHADMRALGYLGNSPMYHKDSRLSKDVIETIAADDWDERVDAVSRGLLGLSVACARCHDHKFDPISIKDYYALAGVFSSTWMVKRPIVAMNPAAEEKLVWDHDRLVQWKGVSALLSEAETRRKELDGKVASMKAEVERLTKELGKVDIPLTQAIIDAGVWIDGSDPTVTFLDVRPGQARDLPVFPGGNVSRPGDVVPRRFLTVLSKGEPQPFRNGSGRLELADAIIGDAAPLAARVLVNRVWGWHFGRPLVTTPSDFGVQGDAPSHPELLEDLAARFVSNGWSMKWLHREIMLSAAYRQSGRPDAASSQADPANKWLWRVTPRRLDVEAWRDSVLQAAGTLNLQMYGPSSDLDKPDTRRTVYSKISRSRLHALFRLYDFPEATQHSPGREITTTPLQQLFVLNSDFFRAQAVALARLAGEAPDTPAKVTFLYRRVFARDPSPKEIDLASRFLENQPAGAAEAWADYAQALLGSNEFIFNY